MDERSKAILNFLPGYSDALNQLKIDKDKTQLEMLKDAMLRGIFSLGFARGMPTASVASTSAIPKLLPSASNPFGKFVNTNRVIPKGYGTHSNTFIEPEGMVFRNPQFQPIKKSRLDTLNNVPSGTAAEKLAIKFNRIPIKPNNDNLNRIILQLIRGGKE